MNRPRHVLPADVRGLGRLTIDGVVATTDLVEDLHQAIAGTVVPIPPTAPGRTRGIAGLVYRSVRGVTRLVGGTLDLALEPFVRWLPASAGTARRDRALAMLNGVVGDHLLASGNPLALPLSLRHAGSELAPDDPAIPIDATGRIAVFAHGLCMNEAIWAPPTDHGSRSTLADQLARAGWSVVHVRYNSGRAIHANGRELAERMAGLCRQWPVPVERLALIGHSMGGLVWRSAVHQALTAGDGWAAGLDSMVFLGTPHLGAPLERAGYGLDRLLGASRYGLPFTRLGRIRSAGIIDLRDGTVVPPEPGDFPRPDGPQTPEQAAFRRPSHGPPRLPAHTSCFAVAATLGKRGTDFRARHVGDGLVPVPSALGQHKDPVRRLPVDSAHRLVVCRTGHVELVHHPEVVRRVCDWLA